MKLYMLIGLLVVQVLLIMILLLSRAGGVEEPEMFLQFDTLEVDRVVIKSPDESIELTTTGADWVLPDGNPADQEKVNGVIAKLADSGADWPVAKTPNAANRFEVADSNFQKHISIYSGEEELVALYLGTSPSFRKVHARLVDENEIYSISFSNYEASTSPSSWLDKKLLQPSGSIKSLEVVGSYKLGLEEHRWTTDSDAELDESKVRSYIDRIESLTVFDISDKELADATSSTELVIEDGEGTYTLTIYHFDVANDWVAESDRRKSKYGVASYIGSELIKELTDLAPDEELELDSEETSTDDIETIILEAD